MDFEEGFEFAKSLLENNYRATLKELGLRGIPQNKLTFITFEVLKEFFDLEDIWGKLSDMERGVLMQKLLPQEILELKHAGWKPDYDPDTQKTVWTHE